MHRNTLLLTAILAVIAALLIGVNIGRNLSQTRTVQPSPTPVASGSPTPTFAMISNSICGISFQYPNTLQALESSTSGMILANVKAPDESIIIACQEDIPRVPLTEDKIDTVILTNDTGGASISAKLYHDASQNDGKPIDKLIFTHPITRMDVFVAGFGNTYQQLITTLKLK